MPAYNGLVDSSNRLRSLSGKTATSPMNPNVGINRSNNNNANDSVIWTIETLADRQLINLLLLLIGKSTDTKTIFGIGNCNGSYLKDQQSSEGLSANKYGQLITGTMDTKGLFWGTNADKYHGVKVFGIEHYWGNYFRIIGGLINDNGTMKVKMTYGTYDGSTTTGYNITGDGYISIGSMPSSHGNITKMSNSNFGPLPSGNTGGSASTYYCDYLYVNNSQVDFAYVGSDTLRGAAGGAFMCDLNDGATNAYWNFGASPSCKPALSAFE
jgi:hypothetical protein